MNKIELQEENALQFACVCASFRVTSFELLNSCWTNMLILLVDSHYYLLLFLGTEWLQIRHLFLSCMRIWPEVCSTRIRINSVYTYRQVCVNTVVTRKGALQWTFFLAFYFHHRNRINNDYFDLGFCRVICLKVWIIKCLSTFCTLEFVKKNYWGWAFGVGRALVQHFCFMILCVVNTVTVGRISLAFAYFVLDFELCPLCVMKGNKHWI